MGCYVLFCSVLFWFVSFRFASLRFVSFRFVSFRFVSFRFVSFRFVSFCFVLFCFVLFCFVLVCLFVCLFVNFILFPSATIWAQGERIHLDRCSAIFVLIAVSFWIEVICMLDVTSQFIRACCDGACDGCSRQVP